MKVHEKFMRRCIQLAEKGLGTTYPNPLVGAVVVLEGRILGEGWHRQAGGPHAEVVAIGQVEDPELLKRSTLYVNLEPCSHHGRTPPCADLIISVGIPKVVIGSNDPNPIVSGRGVARLREAGVEVIQDILAKDCDILNRRFFTYHRKKRPYISLKWAETFDGFMAPVNQPESSGPVWISNALSRQHAHRLRTQEQAILVGAGTVLKDDPSLTAREWDGPNPIRIILDPKGTVPGQRAVFNNDAPTWYVSRKKRTDIATNNLIRLNEDNPVLEQLCEHLYTKGIQSLLVEGGGQTLSGFIKNDLWDEAFIYRGPASWGAGMEAPRLRGYLLSRSQLRDDLLVQLKNPLA